jgi:hypothetical protein
MVFVSATLKEDYWETLELQKEDIECLYHHLLELETPLSPEELVRVLIQHRIEREHEAAERQRSAGGQPYLPKNEYIVGDKIAFPAQDWQVGNVINLRDASTLSDNPFQVIEVEFEDGTTREYATGYENHKLNIPEESSTNDPLFNTDSIMETNGQYLGEKLVETLRENDDFVYIAGRWFPQALIVDVNVGNLNLAEAVLDMAGGGPMGTSEIISQVELPGGVNEKLAEFSLDLALQNDTRFDEVGSAGEVAWYLQRLEPPEVLETPIYLRYSSLEYDRSQLNDQMIQLEKKLDDELSPIEEDGIQPTSEYFVNLIFPHWRSGTLPLSPRLAQLFPTAYESPRVRFMLVDGETGDKFPGWVVRLSKYVFGLREWYEEKGIMPGGKVILRRGDNPGEVIVQSESHRAAKEWVRTALIGADGGVVYATLKQTVMTTFDDWMMVAMPSDISALDQAWMDRAVSPLPFEQVVVDTLRELAKLNPQSHVHAAELYSAVNVIYRCPPGPIMALLLSRPWFIHVGDLHFRYDDRGESEEVGSE